LDEINSQHPHALCADHLEGRTAQHCQNLGAAEWDCMSLAYTISTAPPKHSTHIGTRSIGIQTTDTCSQAELCCAKSQTSGRPPRLENTTADVGRWATRQHLNVTLNTKKRVLRQFHETPKTTKNQLITEAIEQCNVHGRGCCFWHVGLLSLHRHVSTMASGACRETFTPKDAWQCQACYILHDDNSDDESSGDDSFDAEARDPICSFCLAPRNPHMLLESSSAGAADIESRCDQSEESSDVQVVDTTAGSTA